MPTHNYLILCNQINSARFFLFHGSKLWYGFVVLCLEAVQQYGTTYQWLLCQFSSKTFFYRIWYDFIWLLVISCEAKCLRILSFWHWKKALLHLQSSVLHFYRLFNTTPWGTAQKNAFSRCLQSKIHEKAEFDGLHLIWLSYACHFLMSIECPWLNAVSSICIMSNDTFIGSMPPLHFAWNRHQKFIFTNSVMFPCFGFI